MLVKMGWLCDVGSTIELLVFAYAQGTQALRHSGTQALRHSSTQALKHSGTQALRHSGPQASRILPINLKGKLADSVFLTGPRFKARCTWLVVDEYRHAYVE